MIDIKVKRKKGNTFVIVDDLPHELHSLIHMT